MNDEEEKWMEEVFQSMKGSERAVPRLDLFAKIEEEIAASNTKVVPIRQLRYAAAVAAILLFVNGIALINYNQNSQTSYGDTMVSDDYSQSLISTYQIYE